VQGAGPAAAHLAAASAWWHILDMEDMACSSTADMAAERSAAGPCLDAHSSMLPGLSQQLLCKWGVATAPLPWTPWVWCCSGAHTLVPCLLQEE
jgi:hypothetical protein